MKINIGDVVLMKGSDSFLNHSTNENKYCLFCFSNECFSIGTIIEIDFVSECISICMNCKNDCLCHFDKALMDHIKCVIS